MRSIVWVDATWGLCDYDNKPYWEITHCPWCGTKIEAERVRVRFKVNAFIVVNEDDDTYKIDCCGMYRDVKKEFVEEINDDD